MINFGGQEDRSRSHEPEVGRPWRRHHSIDPLGSIRFCIFISAHEVYFSSSGYIIKNQEICFVNHQNQPSECLL